jgi:hypothetical protein
MTSPARGLLLTVLLTLGLTPPLHRCGAQNTAEQRWFKGNTHTHSLWSDGNDFPEMICSWYREQGYQFLVLSDHNTLQRGEKWLSEAAIEKRRAALGPKVADKCRARFGADWVQTRPTADGKGTEIRLRQIDEYRPLLEQPNSFLLVQGEEVSAQFGKAPIHINAINTEKVIAPLKDLADLRETLRANLKAIAAHAKATGKPVLAHLNHPNFRWALTADDLAHVVEDRFFEIYNGHPGIYYDGDPSRVDSAHERIWDIANTIRIAELGAAPLFGVATDDSHQYHGGSNTPGRGWVMVRAEKLSADALVQSMQRGDFYASTGVSLETIDFNQNARRLSLRIAAEPGVHYRTEFRGTRRGYERATREVAAPKGDPQTTRLQHSSQIGELLATVEGEAPTYALTGDELYVRAIVIADKPMVNPPVPGHRQKAWTQPVGW